MSFLSEPEPGSIAYEQEILRRKLEGPEGLHTPRPRPRVKVGDTIETTCEHGLPGWRVLRATVETPEAVAFAQHLVDEERWKLIEPAPVNPTETGGAG